MTDPQMIATAAANIADLLAPLKPEARSLCMKMAEMMIMPAKPRAPRSDRGKSRKNDGQQTLPEVKA